MLKGKLKVDKFMRKQELLKNEIQRSIREFFNEWVCICCVVGASYLSNFYVVWMNIWRVGHAFMPRKFIDQWEEPLTKLADECRQY